MTLWFVFAVMTAAAIFAVLLPLGLGARAASDGREVAVYKDQLAEIERDVETGLIGKVEAEAARVEIGRRLLAAAEQEGEAPVQTSLGLRRLAAVLALIGLPIVALAVYLPLGSPQLPDFPLTARATPADGSQPLENLVSQVEQHLQKNPTDGRGWTVLAPVLARLGRTDDAIRAYRNMITYAGDGASKRADLGEMIAAAAGGVVTAEAKAEFERGHALDADEPKSNYYLGVAAEQDGRKDDAAAIWRKMLSKGPADAPWRPLVSAALARVGGGEAPREREQWRGRPGHDDGYGPGRMDRDNHRDRDRDERGDVRRDRDRNETGDFRRDREDRPRRGRDREEAATEETF